MAKWMKSRYKIHSYSLKLAKKGVAFWHVQKPRPATLDAYAYRSIGQNADGTYFVYHIDRDSALVAARGRDDPAVIFEYDNLPTLESAQALATLAMQE